MKDCRCVLLSVYIYIYIYIYTSRAQRGATSRAQRWPGLKPAGIRGNVVSNTLRDRVTVIECSIVETRELGVNTHEPTHEQTTNCTAVQKRPTQN